MTTAGSFTSDLPSHLLAAQLLIDRCPSLEAKKWLVVALGSNEAVSRDEAHLLMTANQLETV